MIDLFLVIALLGYGLYQKRMSKNHFKMPFTPKQSLYVIFCLLYAIYLFSPILFTIVMLALIGGAAYLYNIMRTYPSDLYTFFMSKLILQGLKKQEKTGALTTKDIQPPSANSTPQNFKTDTFVIDDGIGFTWSPDEAFDQDRTPFQITLIRMIRNLTPFVDYPEKWDSVEQGEKVYKDIIFKWLGHDKEGNVVPLVDWLERGKGRNTDELIEKLCFEAMGSHLLKKEDDNLYVVKLNWMGTYAVRDGLDKYGGDVYFNGDGKLLKIVYGNREYTPNSDEWERVKMMFKTTLNVKTVVGSHFTQTHMVWAQNTILATRSSLSPDHPLRLFLAMFTYRTLAINNSALETLISKYGMVHRISGFAWRGLERFITDEISYKYEGKVRVERFGERCERLRINDLRHFPWRDDKKRYVETVNIMVNDYVDLIWKNQPDAELKSFWTYLTTKTPLKFKEEHLELSKESLKYFLECFIVAVTGEHEDYGGRTPSYFYRNICSGKIWKEGKGPIDLDKQSTMGFAMITMITAIKMPNILGNVDHLFPNDKKAQEIMESWQNNMRKWSAENEKENKANPNRFCDIFDPRYLETSVSI